MSNSTPSPRQFEQTLDIQVPRDAVWRALSHGEEIARWFAPEVQVDAQVGGVMGWKWRDHFDWQQTIDAIEPGKHLRTRYDAWRGQGDSEHPLFIDFHLEGEGGTTTLRIVHSGFTTDSSFDSEFDGISGGWPIELESLRLYLENHHGRDRQLTWTRATLDVDATTAWQKLSAADAFGCAVANGTPKGEAFAFSSGDGDRFEGNVLKADGKEFVGIVKNHGDGFLRLWVGDHEGKAMIWLWLATYGDAPVPGLKQRWDAMVQRLFANEIAESNAS